MWSMRQTSVHTLQVKTNIILLQTLIHLLSRVCMFMCHWGNLGYWILNIEKQISKLRAALLSSVAFARHYEKIETDVLQPKEKEVHIYSSFASWYLLQPCVPYLEMGICSLFLRIRRSSAIPHSSCVLMDPRLSLFFSFLFFFFNSEK